MGNAIIILVILVIATFGAHWGMKHYKNEDHMS